MNEGFRKVPNVTVAVDNQEYDIYRMCNEDEEFEIHHRQALQHLRAMSNLNNENSSFKLLEITTNGIEFIHF